MLNNEIGLILGILLNKAVLIAYALFLLVLFVIRVISFSPSSPQNVLKSAKITMPKKRKRPKKKTGEEDEEDTSDDDLDQDDERDKSSDDDIIDD